MTTTASAVTSVVTELVPVPFDTQTVDDAALEKGTTLLRTKGVDGSKAVTFVVTTKGGVEVSRKATEERVITAPVVEVTAVGTKTATPPKPSTPPTEAASQSPAGCDPNYSGACVPIASDVDCSSGKGNGPAYVKGPVTVIGTDIYGLDSNDDGIGCERG